MTAQPIFPDEPARIALARIPTPLVRLERLGEDLGGVRLLMKRDDLTGLELSGNKVRKLEYLVAEARRDGADTLVTDGGFQSNHCRATAAVGARLGMHVRLILRHRTGQPELDGNLLLDRLFGAEVSFVPPDEFRARRSEIVAQVLREQLSRGRKPYYFPVGASVPLGTWGYIRCAAELRDELAADGVERAELVCAVGSGGTIVGLMLGRALLRMNGWRIWGVPVCDDAVYWQRELRRLERETVAKYRLPVAEADTPIRLLDGFVGPGYAIPYPEDVEAIRLVAQTEGLLLDPTYTGKAFAGMLDAIRSQLFDRSAAIVFIHTGGVFGLFPQRDAVTPPAAP
ncbi:MAG: 1-aminocyclopropane-1-carboxylate deaminase/D-cysteine desulfhydrase [Phycisphaerae bacterium]